MRAAVKKAIAATHKAHEALNEVARLVPEADELHKRMSYPLRRLESDLAALRDELPEGD